MFKSDALDQLEVEAPPGWTGSREDDEVLFVHPNALGGEVLVMRWTIHARSTSGHPEMVLASR